jgi:epoxyqueuosine reductase
VTTPAELAERVRAHALELGFDAVGIARAAATPHAEQYAEWIDAGRHGDMAWMASDRHRERRADPEKLLPGLRSVVCVALCYEPTLDEARAARLGRIARYAGGEDYHRIMRDRLGSLEALLHDLIPGVRTLGYSDTGALLERGHAERAGLGWVGKHSGLLSRTLGSWFLLGELLVDHELDPDPPLEQDHCGTCHRCLDACPTGAIVAPYQVDARLCISYLTIELRGPIPRELRPKVGDWVFGCDVCQEVCPWNRFAPPAREARLHARALDGWSLERFLELDDDGFAQLFATSPIRRARRSGFLRNVCVALGNRRESTSIPALLRAAEDTSPLVRGHAAWALGEIARHQPGPRDEVREALARVARDSDPFASEEGGVALAALGGRA